MEAFISAVLGDLVSRSVSFVMDNYYHQRQRSAENLHQLRHVLLRIQVITEEAEGRHITNRAMLQQLEALREAMYKGCYLLDTLGYRMLLQQKMANDNQVRYHPFALTKFSRRSCPRRRVNVALQGDEPKEVQRTLESLRNILNDTVEFVVFLNSYPPIPCQPYSKYLILEKCMFGRQAEMEKILSFLLQPEPPGPGAEAEAESFQVLPIIGPPTVGKRTLVEHICYDERVRNHFSSIILCSKDPTSPEQVKKQVVHGSSHGRSLFVMELADDFVLDKRQRTKFYSLRNHMPPGSRIIITSRSESITELGTVGAIRLGFLPREAFWYFFKVSAFGSTNPDEHPELASIAMEIAADLCGCFLSANFISRILRANLYAPFWRKILELQREHIKRHRLCFGEIPHDLFFKNQPVYLWSMSGTSMSIKALYFQKFFGHDAVPKIKLHDVMIGSAQAHGKFEAIVLKSSITPYHSYMMTCEVQHHMRAKKKRSYSVV